MSPGLDLLKSRFRSSAYNIGTLSTWSIYTHTYFYIHLHLDLIMNTYTIPHLVGDFFRIDYDI